MSRPRVNSIQVVQRHLENLRRAHDDMEKLCTRCGDCCMATVKIGKAFVVVPELPCRYLVFKGGGSHCSVYEDRHHVAPWCQDLMTGALAGSYPVTCNYMKGMPDYVGGQRLSKADYAHIRPHIQEQLRQQGNREELAKAFHAEDIERFLTDEEAWMEKGFGYVDVVPEEWLNEHYPELPRVAVDYLACSLESLALEREYLSAVKHPEMIAKYIGELAGSLPGVIRSICNISRLPLTSNLVKAGNCLLAYRLGTHRENGLVPRTLNRWLLEKAVAPEVMELIDQAWWFRDGEPPASQEAAILGKGLDLLLAEYHADEEQLLRDLSVFKALAAERPAFPGLHGGIWADMSATRPYHPDQRHSVKINRITPPLWHDGTQWVRTYQPADHYIGAHEMHPDDFTDRWKQGNRPLGEEDRDSGHAHAHSIAEAMRAGFEVNPEAAQAHSLEHSITPPMQPGQRLPGNEDWHRHFGMRVPTGWDGQWVDTSQNDPALYKKDGVIRASEHMQRLRNMRKNGTIPSDVLDALSLFAIGSKQVRSEVQEKHWPKVDAWLKGKKRDPNELVEALTPLGYQNMRTKEFQRAQTAYDTIHEGMQKFPDHGPALRDWLVNHPNFAGSGLKNIKTSFLLQLLGYSGVASVDRRLIQHLTGTRGATVDKLRSKLSKDGSLYAHFENALRNSASYKETDPEGLRTSMAQWRMWDAQGGSDSDHQVLWNTVNDILNGSVQKALGVASNKANLLAALLAYSYRRHGPAAPAHVIRRALHGDTKTVYGGARHRSSHPHKPVNPENPEAERRYGSRVRDKEAS